MFDLHYDLLSILYLCYLKNDFTYIEKIKNNFNNDNVKCLIANLYFMSKKEMIEECPEYGIIDVVKMFEISTNLYKKYFGNIDCIFGIEGCDFVKVSDLEKLYNLGLRSVVLVWNNLNIYGSGPRTDFGFTENGENFIDECKRLGICIDFSHANINTFNGMYNYIDKYPLVIASHSNIRNLTDVPRNLLDDQLLKLKEMNAILGIVSYKAFLGEPGKSSEVSENDYLDHIKYAVKFLGEDNVCISSDDMTFDDFYINDCLFNYSTIANDTRELLLKEFNKNVVEKIMFQNAYKKLKNLIIKKD